MLQAGKLTREKICWWPVAKTGMVCYDYQKKKIIQVPAEVVIKDERLVCLRPDLPAFFRLYFQHFRPFIITVFASPFRRKEVFSGL